MGKRSRFYNSLPDIGEIEDLESQAKRPKVTLDLSPPAPNKKSNISPMCINLGDGIYLEVRMFKNKYYLNFTRYGERFEIKNRFNIPIHQLGVLKKGLEAMIEHVKTSGE